MANIVSIVRYCSQINYDIKVVNIEICVIVIKDFIFMARNIAVIWYRL